MESTLEFPVVSAKKKVNANALTISAFPNNTFRDKSGNPRFWYEVHGPAELLEKYVESQGEYIRYSEDGTARFQSNDPRLDGSELGFRADGRVFVQDSNLESRAIAQLESASKITTEMQVKVQMLVSIGMSKEDAVKALILGSAF